MDLSRRGFMRLVGATSSALALGGAVGSAARAQSAPSAALAALDLGNGLQMISGAGGNVIALAGGDELLLVDSGAAEHAGALRKLLHETFGERPVGVLFNTHWHLDHTGGNDALVRERPMTIVAHENTRLWMSTRFFVEWEDRYYERRERAVWPNKTFFSSDRQPLAIDFGAETVRYGHLLEAHTDGDLYVHFPERNIIVAGGVVAAGRYPDLDYITGGWIGGMADATAKLMAMGNADTLFVPDVGPAQRRDDLEAQLEMLSTVRQRIEAIALEGRGIEDMIAAEITKEFDARYGADSARFIEHAYEGMWWSRLRGIVA